MKFALSFYLDAVGVIGPGMPNWVDAQAALKSATYAPLAAQAVPSPTLLPAAERRRVGTVVKLALAAGLDALQSCTPDAAQSQISAGNDLLTVFTSSGGDGDNCHAICDALAQADRLVSPTRFSNSVHNAPSGYWGIALRAQPASTSICAFDGSFGAGFLDAITQATTHQTSVLLVSYDTPYPEPLNAVRPLQASLAVALLLSAAPSAHTIAKLSVALVDETATLMNNPYLEQLRLSNPSARALPLLQLLAEKRSGSVVIAYLSQQNCALKISVDPCV